MSIEERKYEKSKILNLDIWDIIWYDNHGEIIKSMQLDYPFTLEYLESLAPIMQNYDSGDSTYFFEKFILLENTKFTIKFIAKYNKSKRYLWNKYNTVTSNIYTYERYKKSYSMVNGTRNISNKLYYNITGTHGSSYSFNTSTGLYQLSNISTSFESIRPSNPVNYNFPSSKTVYWIGTIYSDNYSESYSTANIVTKDNGTTTAMTIYTINVNNNYQQGNVLMICTFTTNCVGSLSSPTYTFTSKITDKMVQETIQENTRETITTSVSTYPENGLHTDGYWYTKKSSSVVYSKGTFIDSIYTNSDASYLNNQRNSDGYWYVLQS